MGRLNKSDKYRSKNVRTGRTHLRRPKRTRRRRKKTKTMKMLTRPQNSCTGTDLIKLLGSGLRNGLKQKLADCDFCHCVNEPLLSNKLKCLLLIFCHFKPVRKGERERKKEGGKRERERDRKRQKERERERERKEEHARASRKRGRAISIPKGVL